MICRKHINIHTTMCRKFLKNRLKTASEFHSIFGTVYNLDICHIPSLPEPSSLKWGPGQFLRNLNNHHEIAWIACSCLYLEVEWSSQHSGYFGTVPIKGYCSICKMLQKIFVPQWTTLSACI